MSNALKDIEKIEASLWEAADQLRANSKLTSSEYCMPILGIIFLRHATNRYTAVLAKIEEEKASGKLPKGLPITRAHFISRRALMLPKEARYDELLRLPKGTNLGTALVEAMNAIERDFEPLAGQLPKDFEKFDNSLLESMLRIFDSEALRSASGDVFGRIYEYFLMKFAIQGAQDNGEFFTPPSLVQTIVNVIEPDHGVVADLACGSGGMFVQTSHFIEGHGDDTMQKVTFYGQEKTATTIRLARMNLAVHGLEGDIREANTFYQDEHRLPDGRSLWGNCDFVMANPPFNVDMVDGAKVKDDRRLPFGLPGVNKGQKVSNANYLWISYFHSYLGPKGRAGFVMSSQASSAGHGEAEVRRKIVETGDVDAMISIRSNFFYTRTVPCELWFFDKGKPAARRDRVLMLDARNIYRKVTRKIYDFSPDQQQNIAAIVWLYRGETERFAAWLEQCRATAATHHEEWRDALHAFLVVCQGKAAHILTCVRKWSHPSNYTGEKEPLAGKAAALHDRLPEVERALEALIQTVSMQTYVATEAAEQYVPARPASGKQRGSPIHRKAEADLVRMERDVNQYNDGRSEAVAFSKELDQAVATAEQDLEGGKDRKQWRELYQIPALLGEFRERLHALTVSLHDWHTSRKQLRWLLDRFPDGNYRDVPGLCKIVSLADITAADWSLTPGRYVGVAPADVDEDFDFGQTMRDIHIEISDLNLEAASLAAKIQENFEGLAI